MMIAFDNRIPDAFMLEQLLGQAVSSSNESSAHGQHPLPMNANDRYIAVYDNNQLVGYGHLSIGSTVDEEGPLFEIIVSESCRDPDLRHTIHKLLHARKYSRSS
ncbi:MAG: hypothetical protein K0R67_2079 [Paenibacillus sp.]|jgi:hypothetical protein|nr:hypothetical protein [Paenibacillus sp.]